MLLIIKNVLKQNQLKVISTLLKQADFVDGKLSAGKEAVKVKNNVELAQQSPLHDQLNQMVMTSLLQHPEYQASVFPLKVATPFYARYAKGMEYGFHVDDPVMGAASGGMQNRYRSDISTTVFLNDDYDGGELIIKTAFGEQSIKLSAGDAVVYPSSSLHKVTEVTKGERLVAVTWAQSMIKDNSQRELLYELGQARETLLEKNPNSDETSKVSNVYANLVRRWSEL
ncbi:Fe2+-dependent dioxygenase [Cocleimonas sp. KMM 6892]|jgi:PKHD-type hydroxylase|uniref:Fe2+-dependent dioxygenase n=1 Tax=unclassified Cocleimonas TaxID=2639732 RepID=UPI002DBB3CF5|nr:MULTISPECIES: Fe2+-dependent dioxygenase [unclassified Cocleimonas]MEB8433713.1 Fe2+-dependent dioxygenase [Cocleimonas sp. KMM 6892]MEC4716524.1 Fe2+-dependent dioxygenase [Cocleimonas sp. KMM 6895]MEC4746321.1 Fe2+-dependent dioxygenase [Cocleimonas sp. KMM 6896]